MSDFVHLHQGMVERTSTDVPARMVLHAAVLLQRPIDGNRPDMITEPVGPEHLLEPVESGNQVHRARPHQRELIGTTPGRDMGPSRCRAQRQLRIRIDAPRNLVGRRLSGNGGGVDRGFACRHTA